MVRNMLLDLENVADNKEATNSLINKFFIPGIQPKYYQPLLKRQKCGKRFLYCPKRCHLRFIFQTV